MKPSIIWKQVQSLAKKIRNKDDATKYFEWQKNAIEGIKDTRWLQEIKERWLREYDQDAAQLAKANADKPGKVARYQAGVEKSRKFLERLENMSK